MIVGKTLFFLFALWWFQFLQDFENVAPRPLGEAATHSHCHSSGLEDLFSACSEVNSTADMILYSTVASVADTYTQGNKLFAFLI